METENLEGFESVLEPIQMETATLPGNVFTADDLARAREQEKAKLYPQLEKMKEELSSAKRLAEELAAKEAAKEAELAAKQAEQAEKRKNSPSRNSSVRRRRSSISSWRTSARSGSVHSLSWSRNASSRKS